MYKVKRGNLNDKQNLIRKCGVHAHNGDLFYYTVYSSLYSASLIILHRIENAYWTQTISINTRGYLLGVRLGSCCKWQKNSDNESVNWQQLFFLCTAPPYLLFASNQQIEYLIMNSSQPEEVLTAPSYGLDFDFRSGILFIVQVTSLVTDTLGVPSLTLLAHITVLCQACLHTVHSLWACPVLTCHCYATTHLLTWHARGL